MGRRRWAPAAAALYGLWGVLHLGLGVSMLVKGISAGWPEGEVEAESVMFFVCAAVLGAQAIAVAVVLNRVNSRFGYWLNLAVLGAVDVAFLVVLVVPGHVDPAGGLSGPVIWLLAAAASTVALRCTGGPGGEAPGGGGNGGSPPPK